MTHPTPSTRGWWHCAAADRVAPRLHYFRAGAPLCGKPDADPVRPFRTRDRAHKCGACDLAHLNLWTKGGGA